MRPFQLGAWMTLALDDTQFAAANCIDGDDGPGPSGVVACLSQEDKGAGDPQMLVQFACASGKAVTALSKIELVNRADCCQDWIVKHRVDLVNADGTVGMMLQFDDGRPTYTVAVGARSACIPPYWAG